MKKLLLVLIAIMLACPSFASADEVVNIFMPEDYIDTDVLDQFTKETGIQVNYMRFSTNEEMIVQVTASPGSFDIVFPAEYCVERMNGLGLLAPLDFSKIPNFKNIRKQLLDPEYDPNNAHSVPYMAGTLGILYNKKMVDEDGVKSWGVLWDRKYTRQVLMMDSIRETMGLTLKYLGYSYNSHKYQELRAAADKLIEQKRNHIVKAYGMDEFKDKMVSGEAALAVVASGDAQYALDRNADLGYVIPKEGTNLWVDCICIPASAKNVDNAHRFIDFLCRPDIAVKNIRKIRYMCVNEPAIEMMGEEYTSLPVLNPSREELERCEYCRDLDEDMLVVYNTLWEDVKNAK